MSDQFDELWHFCEHRRDQPMVQIKEELEQVFNLIEGCKSYLEIGTAEGDTLHILGHALSGSSPSITYVDLGEEHTAPYREEIIKIMKSEKINVRGIHGNSHVHSIVKEVSLFAPYDVVMIDAGHELRDVVADAMAYGGLAAKFIIFHDILLHDVGNAFDWYIHKQGFKNIKRIYARGSNYGFGVITL